MEARTESAEVIVNPALSGSIKIAEMTPS